MLRALIEHRLRAAWQRRGPLAVLLWPLSRLYGALAARQRAVDASKAVRLSVPVVVVGNVIAGGAGSGVAELLADAGIVMPVLHLGLPDAFQHHASREQLLEEAGLDAAGIRASVLRRWPALSEAPKPSLSAAS